MFTLRYLIIASFLIGGCHKAKPAMKTLSYPVQIGEVAAQDTPVYLEALGHVQSMTSIQILSRIEGELTGVYFVQGQEVKKGDLLFTIDPKPYRAALQQAEGLLEESVANLALATEKVRRFKTLTNSEFFSQIDYESLQANMAALTAQVEANQGNVASAKINLDYCWIYAPIDGKTGSLQVDFGNLVCVNCSTPLTTLNQMCPIFVTFSIPECHLPLIQKSTRNQSAPLKVLAAYDEFTGDEVFEGSLYMMDNTVDPKTGMIQFKAIFENTKRELWPGQFIRNRLILYTLENAVVIPFTAVQMTQTEPIVFVVNEEMAVEQRTVKLGQRQGDQVIVLEGLDPGEKIVIEGQINLYPNAKVYVPRSLER